MKKYITIFIFFILISSSIFGSGITEKEVKASTSKDINVLKKLSDSKCKLVLRNLCSNENTPKQILIKILSKFYNLKTNSDKNLKSECYGPCCMRSYGVDSEDIIISLLDNKNTPKEILKIIYKDSRYHVRAAIASNTNTPLEILEKMMDDTKLYAALGNNPNITDKMVKNILKNETRIIVLIQLASHPKTPENFLIKFSKHSDKQLRSAVAKNPNCPRKILRELSHDDHSDVRVEVAGNKNTPPVILFNLCLNTAFYSMSQNLADNPNTPPEGLRILEEINDSRIRKSVLKNPNCPIDILNKYLEYYDSIKKMSSNKNTPIKTLRKLSKDPNKEIASIAQETLKKLNK